MGGYSILQSMKGHSMKISNLLACWCGQVFNARFYYFLVIVSLLLLLYFSFRFFLLHFGPFQSADITWERERERGDGQEERKYFLSCILVLFNILWNFLLLFVYLSICYYFIKEIRWSYKITKYSQFIIIILSWHHY